MQERTESIMNSHSSQRPTSRHLRLPPPLIILNKHLPKPQMQQITRHLHRALRILTNQLPRRLLEKLVNLLQRLVLGLRHEEDLVEPAQHRNAPVKAQRQPRTRHRVLHPGEVVRYDEGGEEEPAGRGRHAVGAQVRGVDFGGNDPGEGGVGAEEELVENQAGEVDAELGAECVELVAYADEHEADEEAGQHGDGPETTAALFHEEDGGDGAEEEGAAANEGHVGCVVRVESDLRHQDWVEISIRWECLGMSRTSQECFTHPTCST